MQNKEAAEAAPLWRDVLLSLTFYHGEAENSMSNEEFVALIQAGDTGQIIPLWTNVRLLALKEAGRWAAANRNGVELEDLGQEAFIALLEAVDTFDSGTGAWFSTWYMVRLKGAFTAACGMRTQRERQDPLAGAASLDAPVSTEDQEGITLSESIPDPGAELAMLAVEEDERRARLHDALITAIAELPEEQRAAVRGRYWQGVPVDNRALGKALRALRHPRVSRSLAEFL